MVGRGEAVVMVKQLATRLYADQSSMILRCDLENPPPAPRARISFLVRKLEPKDVPSIVKERPRRLPLILEKIPTCYVAVTNDDRLVYMNWVVLSSEWKQFRTYFAGDLYKELESNECMFEFAYTFEAFRGLGVMGAALAEIVAQLIKEHPELQCGYTYVLDDNIASLKGCRNAGFRPYMERREHWRAMKMREEFLALTPGTRFPFEVSSEKPNANGK
jgi:RimJ/RimL family protein N-acetyltransferase